MTCTSVNKKTSKPSIPSHSRTPSRSRNPQQVSIPTVQLNQLTLEWNHRHLTQTTFLRHQYNNSNHNLLPLTSNPRGQRNRYLLATLLRYLEMRWSNLPIARYTNLPTARYTNLKVPTTNSLRSFKLSSNRM